MCQNLKIWEGTFWSAKIWGGVCPPLPPRLAHACILVSTPRVESHRRACNPFFFILIQQFWFLLSIPEKAQNLLQCCRNGGGPGGPLGPPPIFGRSVNLTQFQPGRADYPHLLPLAPPMFFTFRYHWGAFTIKWLLNKSILYVVTQLDIWISSTTIMYCN